MKPRFVTLAVLAAVAVAIVGLLTAMSEIGRAQSVPARVPFLIATGPSGGSYFPAGQTLAALISSPPGVDRCRAPGVCGPAGLIASARTSDGSLANVLAVNEGRVDSGLAQADVVAEAIAGSGAFHRIGRQGHIVVLAGLFSEDLHLVVTAKSKIGGVAGLRGKRVALGGENSGTAVTARAVLAAYGLSERDMKRVGASADECVQLMQNGKLDAFFFVGATPVPMISDLVARGVAKLAPIDGQGRDRLVHRVPALDAETIAARTYPGLGPTGTVRVRALWLVRDSTPAPLVYAIAKSLYNTSNRIALDTGTPATHAIQIEDATRALPAPLHPGALRFYRENGLAVPSVKANKS